MGRTTVVRVVVAAALVVFPALAAAAVAKEPATAFVCGATGCRQADPALLNPIDGRPFSLATRPRPAPYFAAVLTSPGDEGFCWRVLWVPTRRVIRVENLRRWVPGTPVAGRYWRTVDASSARRLAEGVRGVRPYARNVTWRAPTGLCRA